MNIEEGARRKAFRSSCGLCGRIRRALTVKVVGGTGYRLWRVCDYCDRA